MCVVCGLNIGCVYFVSVCVVLIVVCLVFGFRCVYDGSGACCV